MCVNGIRRKVWCVMIGIQENKIQYRQQQNSSRKGSSTKKERPNPNVLKVVPIYEASSNGNSLATTRSKWTSSVA